MLGYEDAQALASYERIVDDAPEHVGLVVSTCVCPCGTDALPGDRFCRACRDAIERGR